MFLRRDYRGQAIGLLGAFALLIAGVLVTGDLTAVAGDATPAEDILAIVRTADAVHAVDLTQPAAHCDVVC